MNPLNPQKLSMGERSERGPSLPRRRLDKDLATANRPPLLKTFHAKQTGRWKLPQIPQYRQPLPTGFSEQHRDIQQRWTSIDRVRAEYESQEDLKQEPHDEDFLFEFHSDESDFEPINTSSRPIAIKTRSKRSQSPLVSISTSLKEKTSSPIELARLAKQARRLQLTKNVSSPSSESPYSKAPKPWSKFTREHIEPTSLFQTAPSGPDLFQTAPSHPGFMRPNKKDYTALLELFQKHGISKLQPANRDSTTEGSGNPQGPSEIIWNGFDDENDWCGSGMHVDFQRGQKIGLEDLKDTIGHGATAKVDTVLCRRIHLARKTILLRRNLTIREVLEEVRALHGLRHAHILRLVGTYALNREFSMLLYPVCRSNLADFLEDAQDKVGGFYFPSWKEQLSLSSLCLISALRYIHSRGIKHMDIKPSNILLKWITPKYPNSGLEDAKLKVFLCDFGISHIFEHEDSSQTSSFYGRTPKYAAPEVAIDETHGRAADVFSLGCVLAEINTIFSNRRLQDFNDSRKGVENTRAISDTGLAVTLSYHKSIEASQSWIRTLENMATPTSTIASMLEKDPLKRPRLYASTEGPSTTISEKSKVRSTQHINANFLSNDPASVGYLITLRCSHDEAGPEPYEYYDKPLEEKYETLGKLANEESYPAW